MFGYNIVVVVDLNTFLAIRTVSTELTGEGDSIAVPFPRPHPLLEDTRTLVPKREL